jgi:hypothetical protein
MGEGESKYYGCFLMGVKVGKIPGEKVSRNGQRRSLESA